MWEEVGQSDFNQEARARVGQKLYSESRRSRKRRFSQVQNRGADRETSFGRRSCKTQSNAQRKVNVLLLLGVSLNMSLKDNSRRSKVSEA